MRTQIENREKSKIIQAQEEAAARNLAAGGAGNAALLHGSPRLRLPGERAGSPRNGLRQQAMDAPPPLFGLLATGSLSRESSQASGGSAAGSVVHGPLPGGFGFGAGARPEVPAAAAAAASHRKPSGVAVPSFDLVSGLRSGTSWPRRGGAEGEEAPEGGSGEGGPPAPAALPDIHSRANNGPMSFVGGALPGDPRSRRPEGPRGGVEHVTASGSLSWTPFHPAGARGRDSAEGGDSPHLPGFFAPASAGGAGRNPPTVLSPLARSLEDPAPPSPGLPLWESASKPSNASAGGKSGLGWMADNPVEGLSRASLGSSNGFVDVASVADDGLGSLSVGEIKSRLRAQGVLNNAK